MRYTTGRVQVTALLTFALVVLQVSFAGIATPRISYAQDASSTVDQSATTDTNSTDSVTTDESASVDTTSADDSSAVSNSTDTSSSDQPIVEGVSTTDTTTSDSSSVGTEVVGTGTEADGATTAPVAPETPTQAPVLTTDKPDYDPGQTATIFGSFFQALQNIVLNIFGAGPDGNDYTETNANVTTDTNGSFSFAYLLDNIYRPLYTVIAKAVTGEQLASTTFTDSYTGGGNLDNFSQCMNDDGDGYATGDAGCRWTNGDLNGSNSTYHEDDATVQRLAIKDLTNGPHYAIIKYSTTKGGKHSYDFMTDDNYSELAPNPLTPTDLCDPALTNLGTQAQCAALAAVPSGLIPTDPNAAGHDIARANRHFNIRNGAWVGTGIQSGPTLLSGTYAGDSDTIITIGFSVNTATCANKYTKNGTDVCEVLITWGAHVSSQADWGNGNSAVNINGSPYHVQLANIDNPATTGGGNDNQMSATAVIIPAAIPTVTTHVHNASHTDITSTTVAPGTVVHDNATVDTGASTPVIPTGSTFTFHRYTTGDCSGTPTDQTGVAVPSGAQTGTAESSTFTPTGGSFSYMVDFVSGDATKVENATGICEPFSVQGTSTVATTLHKADHTVLAEAGSVALGSIIHDSATVTPSGTVVPTGNVDFRFYATVAACTSDTGFTGGTTAGSIALNGANPGVAHPSTDTGPLGAGTYAFKAKWAGDTNYTGNTSSCETFTVNKAQLGVTTNVHNAAHVDKTNSNVPLGSVMHDTATLTGVVAGFTAPTPTFTLTNNYVSTCSAGSAVGNDGTEGSAAKSADSTTLGAGIYAYRGSVGGNANYLGADSTCEPFTVDKAQLTVNTTVHTAAHAVIANNAHVPLGTNTHDNATVTGAVSGFTIPAISFTFNAGAIANGSTEGGFDATTAATGALGAGNYVFNATVAGSANYLGDTSDQEPFVVDKAQLGITTTIHDAGHTATTTVALGSIVHDTAAVTGAVGGFAPTGAVTFTFDKMPSVCGTTSIATAGSLDGGNAASVLSSALNAGSYNFQGAVAGDANYLGATSTCEPLTVNKADLSIATTIHDADHAPTTSVALGSIVHDTAVVSGQVGSIAPTGATTFTFDKTPSECGTTAIANNGTESSNPRSADTSALIAGTYNFRAVVAGDDNYNGATSSCEPLTVNKAQLRIDTTIHDAGHNATTTFALGSVAHDTAAVAGQVGSIAPTGAVTFYFGSGVAENCKNTELYPIIATAGSPDAGNGNPRSIDTAALAAGNYQFWAHVSGDDNYTGADSGCEPMSVNKAQLTVDTIIHDAGHNATTTVALGSIVHDTATVTGGVSGFAVPTPTFTFTSNFNGDTCTQGAPVAANGADGSATKSADSAALGAGTYAYRGSVAGNSNYFGDDSPCEPLTVNKAQLDVTTLVHNAAHSDITSDSIAAGSVVHDTATVTGAVVGFTAPTPTFTLTSNFDGEVCDEGAVVANNGTEGSADKSANSASLSTGSYAYRGSVAGNDNYIGDDSDCEPFKVVNAKISITPSSDTNEVNDDHDFIVKVEADNGDGTGYQPVNGAIANAIATPTPDTLNVSDCNAGTDVNGECTVTINSSTTGAFTIMARSTISVNGVEFKLQTNGAGDNSGPAVKTYIDLKINIDSNSTNAVGVDHTFTVTVKKDTGNGSGFVNAAGLTVTPSISGTGTLTGTGTCETGVTDASGQCTIIVHSTGTGVATVGAATSWTFQGVTVNRSLGDDLSGDSAEATKTWVNARISITPATANNEVDDAHTMTVTVEQDNGDGAGFVAVPEGTLANAIVTPAPDGGINASDCTDGVDASGQCDVTINSSVAGVFTTIARSTVVVGGVTFKLQTNGSTPNSGPAVKNYVDAKIVLTPGQATNNVNDPHTITATVTEDPGTGPVAASGETVTFSLVNNTAGASFVGGIDTCTTNGSGQCTVQINSATPGTVEIHGSVDVGVSALTLHRESDSTHGSSANANKTYVAGKIMVIKQTLPDGSLQSFDFTPNYESGFSLTDGQSNTSGWLAPTSTYSISEIVPTGWDQTGATCDNGTPAAITVAANATTTCTFTNTQRGHIIVDKVTDPSGDSQSFSFDGTGGTYADFSLTDVATPNDQELVPGTYGVSEAALANWTQTSATCDDGSPVSAISLQPGETVHCTFTNTKKGKITIVKDAQPNDCQNFAFAMTGQSNFSLDDDAGVADCQDTNQPQSMAFNNLVPGNFTTTETLPNQFWKFDSVSCVNTVGGTAYTNVTNTTNGVTVALNPGADVTCTFVNLKVSPTRTLGFWQTHTAYTSGVFAAAPISSNMPIGTAPHKGFITTVAQLFGAFYANIAKTTTNQQRTAIDKARMQLLQQLVAAKLNCASFGCAATVATMISNADTAYYSGTAAQIIAAAGQLDAYNNSGDTITIGSAGSATPNTSKGLADLVYWNAP